MSDLLWTFLFEFLSLGGLAPRNPVPADFRKDVLNKYLPVIRQYGMDAAADHLSQWVCGTLPLEPLLPVSAFLGVQVATKPFVEMIHNRLCDATNGFERLSGEGLFWASCCRCAIKSKPATFGSPHMEPRSFEPAPGNLALPGWARSTAVWF